MGKRPQVVLVIVVDHCEGQFALKQTAALLLLLKIIERVVHPAKIPFKRKPQSVGRWRTRHPRPIGGLLSDGYHTGILRVHDMIGVLEKLNRFQITIVSALVRGPLALLSRVIKIKHRRHRVHTQPVHVEHVTPVKRIADEEIAHFPFAVVKHQRTPFRMVSTLRIRMFIKWRAIKSRQSPFIPRKMCRHPVDNYADPGLMQRADQELEIIGRAIAAGRRKKTGDLITPGGIIRMLCHRQKFDVSKAHLTHVIDQRSCQFAVTE